MIFNKQNKLIITYFSERIKFIKRKDTESKYKSLELVLKNCPNIRSVNIETDNEINEVLELIIKYCNKLSEIEFSYKYSTEYPSLFIYNLTKIDVHGNFQKFTVVCLRDYFAQILLIRNRGLDDLQFQELLII